MSGSLDAFIYFLRGMSRKDEDARGALEDFDLGIGILERVCEEKQDPAMHQHLAKFYIIRADLRAKGLDDYSGASGDYDRAIELLDRFHKQGESMDENDIGGAYVGRAWIRKA